VLPLLLEHDTAEVRPFDAEAWAAAPSDVLVATTNDLTS
jgi:hypothetical protein